VNEAESLIEKISSEPRDPNVGAWANDLLRRVHQGYPVEKLRPLLLDKDEDVVATGTWIASELGANSDLLLPDVLKLLNYPAKKVRFWALDCLYWASPLDGVQLAEGVKMVEDVDSGVRWKALDFLSRASVGQLGAALATLRSDESGSMHIRGLEFLLNEASADPTVVRSYLNSSDPLSRKYGVIAAVRLPMKSPELLDYALSMDDADVQAFARGKR
jgi:hypothetical protein